MFLNAISQKLKKNNEDSRIYPGKLKAVRGYRSWEAQIVFVVNDQVYERRAPRSLDLILLHPILSSLIFELLNEFWKFRCWRCNCCMISSSSTYYLLRYLEHIYHVFNICRNSQLKFNFDFKRISKFWVFSKEKTVILTGSLREVLNSLSL